MKSQVAIWKNLTKFAYMMKRFSWASLLLCFLAAFYILQSSACANIVPPSGGPKDTTAPYLVIAKPHDSATQIHPKEVWMAFNEYITLNSIQENLLISPTLKNTPLVESKLTTLHVKLNDSLVPNTTYQIQFGAAIKDVNEGNIAQNFSYVFSTGDHIDSGRIQGTVQMAETGKFDSTLIVVLQPAGNDTAIFKNRPWYYTKLNGKGKFGFKFLPITSFNVFVLPNDYTKRYDDSTKLFAFNPTPVKASNNKDSLQLYVFQTVPKAEKKKVVNKQAKRNSATLKYSKNLDGSEQDLLHPLHLIFEGPIALNDSFPIVLADTLNKPVADVTIKQDSLIPNTVVIEHVWPSSTKFHLIVPQNAIHDSLNNKLVKTDTLAFITKPNTAYGTCLIRVDGYDKIIHPILLLTQDDRIKFSYPITKNLLNIAQLPAGDYQLKVLQDDNNNGKWDTGKYGFGFKPKQPEMVIPLPYKLNIRADWDNELNITINK